ncbi:unnamed protein product [Albugo candida]|uniref:Myosin motor domain-containing protein n=1 Tax=Albugo candida TaxID=65357 RepID=A0A024G5I8_9STRA|nr:unnamed protein product [Albugo candida]|eukprot:CCI42021.1 unnamed protein product [Albugo candida]
MAPGGKIERYQVPQNPSQACARRDSLAKIIYGRIFDFLVERINHALDLQRRVDEMETTNASHRTLNMDEMPKLGILDIYGFEVFDQNGFEQFCINYVNEKLQQLFIELTLRSEQDEYAREGIEWTPIPFFNNKVVCDLMDANYIKQTRQAVAQSPGIFLVLDDTVKTMHSQEGEAIDKTFLDKVTSTHQNHPHFAKRGRDFGIRHYAGTVQYQTQGFGDTNKGAVSPELYSMLQKSKNKLIRYLFPASDMEEEEKRSSNRRKQMAAPTAGSKIRTQCEALIQTLMECSPHYVRCLKSNDQKQANRFDDGRVLHQIQYLGLLENLRVRRSGFAYRGEYGRFLDRFRIISSQTYPDHVFTGSDKKGTQLILRSAAEGIPKLKEEAQFGKTMVFIRTPETLFAIEKLREEVIGRYARKIQHTWRSYFGQRYFLKLNHDISKLYEANGKLRQRVSICRPFHGKYLLKENTDEIHSRISEIMRFYGDSEKIIFVDFVDKIMPRAGPRNNTKDIELTKGFWDCGSVYSASRLLVLSDQYLYVIEETIPSSVEGGDSRNEKVPKSPMYRLRQRAHITMIEGILLSTYADPCFILQIQPEPLLKEPIRNNWLEDRSVLNCMDTGKKFGLFNRRHHCRFTGKIYCDEVCKRVEVIPSLGYYTPVRVHDSCIGNISTEMLEDQLFLSEKKSEIVSLLADTIRLLGDGKTIPVQFENSVQLRTASDKELSRSPQQKIIFSTAACDELKLTGDQNSLQIYAPTGVPKEYSVNRRKRAKARRQRSEATREEERAQRAQRRVQLEQEREHDRIERIKLRKAKKQADKDARMRAARSSDTNASLLVQSESNKMRSSRNYTNTNTPGFTQQDSGGMGSELAAILARRRGNVE